MRTQEEKDRQIAGILKEKETLPAYSAFGTPNWEMADIQVSIIKGETDIDDLEEDWGKIDEGEPDEIYNAASDADWWLKNKEAGDLFDDE